MYSGLFCIALGGIPRESPGKLHDFGVEVTRKKKATNSDQGEHFGCSAPISIVFLPFYTTPSLLKGVP